MERLATKVAEESRLLDAKLDNCKGNMCLAKYFCDGEWYRAQVYPVQSPQHVNVFFVDYGNKQVSEKSNVAAIPKRAVDLLLTPMQALRCSLLNVPESEHLPNVNKWLEMEVLNKSFSARFITCDDNGHFLCDLYDGSLHINEMVKDLMGKSSTAESGPSFSKPAKEPKVDNSKAVLCKANRLDKVKPVVKHKTKPKKTPPKMHKNLQTSKLQIKPCPPKRVPLHQSLPKLDDLPPLGIKPGSRLLGFVSHWNSAKSFFIQMDDDEPKILQMCERLNSTEFKNTKENVANEMKIGDLVAAQYEEDMALYRAVITNVSNSGLLAVEFIDYGNTATVNRSSVYKLTNPFLSHPRLSTPCTHANLDSFGNDECFKEKTADKPLMVEFLQQLQTKWKVSIEFVDDCAQENSKTLNSDEYQTKDVAKCQTVSSILDDLPEVLAPLPDVHLVPGTSCLVMSEEKKKWCRAEIVDCDLSSVLLNLVDNGQYAVLSRQDACQMKKLPEALIELPKVTYHCLLRGVKPNGPDWSDEAIVFFQNSMCNRSLQIHFGQQVSETQWEVDIIAGNQNLAKELVDLDHAVNIDNNNTLGVKFQHEQGSNIESDQEAISWFGTDSTTSEKATEDQHPLEQVALNHLTQSAVLGPTENTKLHLPSGIKQCALM
ncbi:hypothetical protein DNTS_017407 [Danionella cerebrum]|uniref:Tudor domain-containing protein n=1 Tax=Danionella cerebrum TaxID=2873325 RepID=A0A553MYC0_9TELE|nr:hypothetical protein DNTS_017407 [Danionella translucida]